MLGIGGVIAFTGALIFIGLTVWAVFFGKPVAETGMEGWQPADQLKLNKEIFARPKDEKFYKIAHRVPGTMTLVFVLLISFMVYYFSNWKALADVWFVR